LQPRSTCWISDCALYCVRIAICRIPELTQLDSTKSMMRNLPPKGVAGLQRCCVSALRRSPRPPAMITASVPPVKRLTQRPVLLRAACRMSRSLTYSANACIRFLAAAIKALLDCLYGGVEAVYFEFGDRAV